MTDYRTIWRDGLWENNAGLVQLLGLCPLLAVSNTLVNGLGLGIATLLVLIATNLCVSVSRRVLSPEIRIPVYVLIIAAAVSTIELLMRAYLYPLYLSLGIFIPLIVTNCAIIGRAEAFASRNPPLPSLVDALATGTGFCAVLVTLGGVRELIAQGTLFSDAHLLLGEWATSLSLTLIPEYRGFLIAALPPGAFITLGCLVAAKRWIDSQRTRSAKAIVKSDPETVAEAT